MWCVVTLSIEMMISKNVGVAISTCGDCLLLLVTIWYLKLWVPQQESQDRLTLLDFL